MQISWRDSIFKADSHFEARKTTFCRTILAVA